MARLTGELEDRIFFVGGARGCILAEEISSPASVVRIVSGMVWFKYRRAVNHCNNLLQFI